MEPPVTPMLKTDLRRRTLVQNAMVSSPIRKSLPAPGSPMILLERQNDESERSNRRQDVAMVRRISGVTPTAKSPLVQLTRVIGEQQTFEHFQVCTKLYTENRINLKNAWELHIIDMLRQITTTSTGNPMKVASTSLDISSKVYGIRVDDVHTVGLKLASSISRADPKENGPDQDENESGGEGAGADNRPKKRQKKKMAIKKNTIEKDEKNIFSPVPKMESAFFTTREDIDISATDNLLTIQMPQHPAGHKFLLLQKDRYWDNKIDPYVQENAHNTKMELAIPKVNKFTICHIFNDFATDEWNPDEDDNPALDKSTASAAPNDVVLDDNGMPIAELDGSVHNIFENVDDNDDAVSETEERQNDFGSTLLSRGRADYILDATPDDHRVETEYGYNTLLKTSSGKVIDKIWAGPSHWKLKCIRRTNARYSGSAIQIQAKNAKKKSKEDCRLMFDVDDSDVPDDRDKLVIKRSPAQTTLDRITLPVPGFALANFSKTVSALMLKPAMYSRKNVPVPNSLAEGGDVEVYNYDNPNDSQYCSQHNSSAAADGDGGGCDDGDLFQEVHERFEGAGNFGDENLVEMPELVPNAQLAYATFAKKVDMKKLKAAVWFHLTRTKIEQTQNSNVEITDTTFSLLFKELPSLLSSDMKNDLSCPLAFVTLLHICNEQNLRLIQHPDYKDFEITKENRYG